MNLLIAGVSISISIIALVLSISSFRWSKKVSMLSADNNIIQYVSTLLIFLEKVKTLDVKEREIFKKLLGDAEFFGPTTKKTLDHLALKPWHVDKELEEYFKSI